MITSAANSPWPQDVSVGDDYRELGLPIPSVIRLAKVTALDNSLAEIIGRAGDELLARVLHEIASIVRLKSPDESAEAGG